MIFINPVFKKMIYLKNVISMWEFQEKDMKNKF